MNSQSSEFPVALPDPAALNVDIDRILAWHAEFKARK
jgi:hypothetical protein